MPRKSAAGHGRKRGNEDGEMSPSPAKVAKTVTEGEWRSSSIWEKDLLWLIAERVLQEKGIVQWRPAGTDSSPEETTVLGIRSHFNLFRHLFRLKPQPDECNPELVGGAGVQLRDKMLYLEYTTPSSLSGWHRQWFYIGNLKPSLPGRDNSPP
ncbi:putative gypsy-type retrotransposon protein [Panicum miliaceum]|uniref:Gypsy-type retrotransposon protein n=1 Tax=Panicum miliaceum TaxID=4540 RepID=A0A3L6SMS4_PANMI|nr:putative gypsy-type retrotransposon protein [Panicum miliaceum]